MCSNGETTWAVAIAQLTHHAVRGELIVQCRPPMSFDFYPTLHMCKFFILLEVLKFFKRAKDDICPKKKLLPLN